MSCSAPAMESTQHVSRRKQTSKMVAQHSWVLYTTGKISNQQHHILGPRQNLVREYETKRQKKKKYTQTDERFEADDLKKFNA